MNRLTHTGRSQVRHMQSRLICYHLFFLVLNLVLLVLEFDNQASVKIKITCKVAICDRCLLNCSADHSSFHFC